MLYLKRLWAYINSFSRRTKIIAAAVLVVLLVVFFNLGRGSGAIEVADAHKHVTLASVASLSNGNGPLPVTGKVTSVSQANLVALQGGQITSLPRKLGDRVAAGAVVVGFENSSQQAAVLQAQGSYDAAVASQRAVSPEDTRLAAVSAYRSAYNTLDTTLEQYIDDFFGGPGPYGPQLLISAPNYDFGELSRDRARIRGLMTEYQNALATADTADAGALLDQAIAIQQEVSDFANKLAVAANRNGSTATSDQLDSLSTARSTINALGTTLSTALSTYRSGSVSTTASTQAGITSALGGLRAAQASLEKTYVRAPISGTIVSLPVNRGDFISPGTTVAVISNPGALQIEAHVTSSDAKTLSVGGKAIVEGTVAGVITFIAPALDPLTGKIQVKVGLPQGQGSLVDGSTVSVSLERAGKAAASKAITIPLSAAKMTPDGPVVFTVASSTLVAHKVEFGPVVGGQVTILGGVTPQMDIVVDARGLSEGQVVVVDAD